MKISKLRFLNSLLFILFLVSCNGQSNPDCLIELNEKLSPKINEENKIGEVINIKDDVNCFEWDTLIVQMAINDKAMTEKALGIKIPFEYDYIWEDDSIAMLLFVKNNIVVHYILQGPKVNREIFDDSKSIKCYSFLDLTSNYGDNAYAIIPKEKAIFETYQTFYHDENGKKVSNPKFGLGIKVKELSKHDGK